MRRTYCQCLITWRHHQVQVLVMSKRYDNWETERETKTTDRTRASFKHTKISVLEASCKVYMNCVCLLSFLTVSLKLFKLLSLSKSDKHLVSFFFSPPMNVFSSYLKTGTFDVGKLAKSLLVVYVRVYVSLSHWLVLVIRDFRLLLIFDIIISWNQYFFVCSSQLKFK